MTQLSALGMPWYQLEDFPRIKAMMLDGDRLHRTYAEWRIAAEQGERQLRRQGHLVVRAHLRPDEFAAWCAQRGLRHDVHGRNQFAAWVAAETYRNMHGGPTSSQ